MIAPEDRFWVTSASLTALQQISCIIDWDQRRWYRVEGPLSLMPPEEGIEIDILTKYIDKLSLDVCSITVDNQGKLVSVLSDPEDDDTMAIYYPPYSQATSLHDSLVINRSKLIELDRLGPEVDWVSYIDDSGISKEVVFKYNIIYQLPGFGASFNLLRLYLNILTLISFDRVVLEDAEARILGFTIPYVAGGTLETNTSRVFRLEWLKQLTDVVDYLNLHLGILHQDVAPRNIAVDPETNKVILFDFDRSAPICRMEDPKRNDISGVIFTLYEIITQDNSFRRVPFEEQDAGRVLALKEWPAKAHLDNDLSLYRNHLDNWVQIRTKMQNCASIEKGNVFFALPDMPPATPLLVGQYCNGAPLYSKLGIQKRTEALKANRSVVSWERSPSQKVEVQQ
ncbi:hypothetical protein LOZ39_005600 [Ophidiomyces ophidiicola]|nr:hypothetical protein LOZ49_004206 [Ophidiomyces ophidiicola]KAI2068894.1 hypothetical protein LOZ39_005600 [Ophidiomyces ophidiicola]KAI2139100.1 hypothetical protein LOZ29_002531 [Ophidiomyces ophidiicola]KAI2140071.1 hypothetical protein LOZ28_003010 [Ophidiomyces ophidiicola]KAI2220151.1 hypothetical protein LOZ15_002365 [Ophidiomyces ophidiicola]